MASNALGQKPTAMPGPMKAKRADPKKDAPKSATPAGPKKAADPPKMMPLKPKAKAKKADLRVNVRTLDAMVLTEAQIGKKQNALCAVRGSVHKNFPKQDPESFPKERELPESFQEAIVYPHTNLPPSTKRRYVIV